MSKATDSTLALILLLISTPQHVRSEPRALRSPQLSEDRLQTGTNSPLSRQPGQDHFSQSLAGKVMAHKSAPYAELSNMIYRDAASDNSGEWQRSGNAFVDKRSGLKVATYRNDDGKIAVVFQGSQPGQDFLTYAAKQIVWPDTRGPQPKQREATKDWLLNNLPQHLVGAETRQYELAKEYVQKLINSGTNPRDIVVTGHSLGGGLAQYAASMATLPDGKTPARVDAYTFNAAGLGFANQTRAVLSDGWSNIVNIYTGDDPLRLANALTPATGNLGQVIVYGGGRGDQPGGHDIGALSRDLTRLARQFEQSPEFKNWQRLEERRRAADFNRFLRREARREHLDDRRTEYRADQLRDLDRQAEYQLSKSAIDVHGNRVRIDTYIKRPNDTQVEHWVLNFRNHRFDYGYIRRTYAQPLANLSDINAIDRFTFQGSASLPANYLVRREDLASNGADRFFWNLLFGAPILTNSPGGARYFPASLDSTLRVQGAGFDVAKQQFTQFNNLNDYRLVVRHPNSSGVLAPYLDQTFNRLTGVCNPCLTDSTVAPTIEYGPNATRLRLKDNTWLSFELWTLRDDGTQLPIGPIASSNDVNIEQRFRSSEMQGRDIDIIFPSKFFPDANSQ